MRRYLTGVMALAFLCLSLCIPAAVSYGETGAETSFYVYYVSGDGTRLERRSFQPADTAAQPLLEDLKVRLADPDAAPGGTPLLSDGLQINSFQLQDSVLRLVFNGKYDELEPAREILVRAGAVKTFQQVPGVSTVTVFIGEKELVDSKGIPAGPMTGDSFVEMSTSDKDSYRYDTFTLYFTDQEGKKLIPETRRVYYRRSIPIARVALEQLANGPIEKGRYPTLPETLQLNNILLSDNICYADFDRIFVDRQLTEVDEEVVLYSVVNTLLANTRAEEVLITINGEYTSLKNGAELNRFFSFSQDLVSAEEES